MYAPPDLTVDLVPEFRFVDGLVFIHGRNDWRDNSLDFHLFHPVVPPPSMPNPAILFIPT